MQQELASGAAVQSASATFNNTAPGNTEVTSSGFGADGQFASPEVRFDPATETYSISGGGSVDASFGPGQFVSDTDGVLLFSFTDAVSGDIRVLALLDPVAENPALDLTYSSFGIRIDERSGGAFSNSNTEFFVFGVPTAFATRPTSGTATYSGSIEGFYDGPTNDVFILGGTSTLSANFAANTISTTAAITGVGRDDAAISIDLGVFSGSGDIVQFLGSTNAGFQGALANSSNNLLTGNFFGSFFGPNAEEFGYSFFLQELNSAGTVIGIGAGVTVGEQN